MPTQPASRFQFDWFWAIIRGLQDHKLKGIAGWCCCPMNFKLPINNWMSSENINTHTRIQMLISDALWCSVYLRCSYAVWAASLIPARSVNKSNTSMASSAKSWVARVAGFEGLGGFTAMLAAVKQRQKATIYCCSMSHLSSLYAT